MKIQPKLLFVLALPILGLAAYAAWQLMPGHGSHSQDRKVSFYQDSMHPWIKSSQPGKCTICAMDMTPIYEGEKGLGDGENVVALSSNSITVLNVQTEEVKHRALYRNLRVAGTLEANETRKTIIAAPAPCRIQALAVEYAGAEVVEGQTLMTLFSPELIQKRGYLRALGMSNRIERTTTVFDSYSSDLVSPQSGTVVERNVYQGQYVQEGEKLLAIVDASSLWFRFDVYERQLPWFETGQKIQVTMPSMPGKVFQAVITFIEPTINDAARTVKVRAEIANPMVTVAGKSHRLLRFGMYAEGRVRTEIPNALAVSRSAILFPGDISYAYVDKGNGAFERRRVKLGRQGDELWEVLSGLEEGDIVVTSGNVLIDSQAQFNQSNKTDGLASDETDSTEMASAQASAEPAMIQSASSDVSNEMEVPARKMSAGEQKALAEFFAVADGISRALAADNLAQLKTHTDKLPGVAASLLKATGSQHPWQPILQRIEAASHWPEAENLAAARKSFLGFSTNVVALVQLTRTQEEDFRTLKVFHCPMAPKPGLWFQANGPLRNPYYGSEMLTCGNEVKAGATPKPAAPEMQMADVKENLSMPALVASEAAPAPDPMPNLVTAPMDRSRAISSQERSVTRNATRDDLLKMRLEAIAKAAQARTATAASPPANGGIHEEVVSAHPTYSETEEVRMATGEKLWKVKMVGIAAANRANNSGAVNQPHGNDVNPATEKTAAGAPGPIMSQPPTNRPLTYRQGEAARIATRDEMLKVRMSAMAQTNKANPPAVAPSAKDMPPMMEPSSTHAHAPVVMPPSTNRALNHRQTEAARITTRDEMLKMRMNAMAQANKGTTAAATAIPTNHVEVMPENGTKEPPPADPALMPNTKEIPASTPEIK